MESEKTSTDSQTLAQRVAAGDDLAADTVFQRYLRRLTALARARLAPRVGRRVDPDDAVQSAFLSFFLGARRGQFTIERSGDLWRLLATITARKVARLVTFHQASKRNVRREASPYDSDARSDFQTADPHARNVDEAAILADELADIMQQLPTELRSVLQMRLQDASIAEIASSLGRTERTVRRKLEELREWIARRRNDELPQAVIAPRLLTENEPVDSTDAVSSPQATPSPNSVGSIPTIDYRDLVLLAHLGSGGMGRVYRAWRRSTDEHLAVKVLRKSLQDNPPAVARFLAEIRTVAALDHPGITRLYGLGRMPAGGYFFVMQLVERFDLQQRLQAGPVADQEIAGWMIDAARAVGHAHARGIVHCDLKPSNLLIDRMDRIVVSDFGFAVALSETKQPIGGTKAYLAPELFAPQLGEVSPAVDVWGLGAVLYALIYGRPPWIGLDATAISGPTTFPTISFPPTASPFLDLCRTCLTIDPQVRLSSVEQIADRIAIILSHLAAGFVLARRKERDSR